MNPLLILGASTRAAAFSAIRAGFDPISGDMFADADLRAHARIVLDVPDYPRHLLDAVRHLPASTPWIYTGALENSPGEVDRVSQQHELWGNPVAVLRRCRDPWQCARALQEDGIATLSLRSSCEPPERDGSWLLKPLRSAGGRGIVIWSEQTPSSEESHYFQRFVKGTPISGTFVAGDGWVRMLGITTQLIGLPELNAPEFAYCGSLYSGFGYSSVLNGPVEAIQHVGWVLGMEFGLRGLFGVDFIDDGEHVWMTELNPRYTASMELIEYGCGKPLMKWHRRACQMKLKPLDINVQGDRTQYYSGKVILYADRSAVAPDLSQWIPSTVTLDELPVLADIPAAGTHIWPGQPVFSCLGEGFREDKLLEGLISRARDLWQTFPRLD